jgi:hypothetical protein
MRRGMRRHHKPLKCQEHLAQPFSVTNPTIKTLHMNSSTSTLHAVIYSLMAEANKKCKYLQKLTAARTLVCKFKEY